MTEQVLTEQDDGSRRSPPPRLSRRTVLGGLAAASLLPWLARATRGDGDGSPTLAAPLTSSLTPLPRQQHTATPLGGGYILLVGGLYRGALADAEILGPDGTLRAAAPLNIPRYAHAAVRLSGGQVVVLGGFNQGPLADVEMYDSNSDTWTPLPPLSLPRYLHAASHLSDAKILLTGGCFQGILSETELYVL